jgi:hypothetical protein
MGLNVRRFVIGALASAIAGWLVAPAGALAGPAFTVGTQGGTGPAVVVDGGGTAHVVWKDNGANAVDAGNLALDICNLPPDAISCSSTASLLAPTTAPAGDAFNFTYIGNAIYGDPAIFAAGSDLDVVSTYTILGSGTNNADNLELEWQSTDGGVTWSNPAPIGTFDNFFNSSIDAGENIIYDAPDNLFLNGPWGHPGGAFGSYNVQANPAASTFPATDTGSDPPGLELNQTGPGGQSDVTPFAALTLNPAATPGNGAGTLTASLGQGGGSVVGVWDNAQNGYDFNYAYLNPGVTTTAANLDDSANWTTTHMPAAVALDGASLTSGPRGPFLMEDSKGYPTLSEWNEAAASFSHQAEADCQNAATSGAGLQSENLSEDPNGLLHLVYSTSTNFVGKLKYSDLAAATHGYLENYPVTLDTGGTYQELRSSVNASSRGLVVWEDPGMSGGLIRAVWLPSPLPARAALPGCRNAFKRTIGGRGITVTTSTAPHTFRSEVPFTITATGKLAAGTKITRVAFYIGQGFKELVGTGHRRLTVYVPNGVSATYLGTHTLTIGTQGVTTPITAAHQVAVRVVFSVTKTRGTRATTQTATISVPISVYKTLP